MHPPYGYTVHAVRRARPRICRGCTYVPIPRLAVWATRASPRRVSQSVGEEQGHPTTRSAWLRELWVYTKAAHAPAGGPHSSQTRRARLFRGVYIYIYIPGLTEARDAQVRVADPPRPDRGGARAAWRFRRAAAPPDVVAPASLSAAPPRSWRGGALPRSGRNRLVRLARRRRRRQEAPPNPTDSSAAAGW